VAHAIAELVVARPWDGGVDITLPIFYPSGSAACLGIERSHGGFTVTDNGLAYREIEQIGGEKFFAKNAKALTEGLLVWHNTREILSDAPLEALSSVMADVAAVSARLAWKVMANVGRKGEAELSDYLFVRLQQVFGAGRVEREVTLTGPSTKKWRADAVVHLEGGDAVFEAVSNNHLSVYPTVAMFHDLALSEVQPVTISVVKNKKAMGSLFNILAQAGHVIEEAQANEVYQKAALLQPF